MTQIVWLIANTVWFGFFFYVIVMHDWAPWSLIVPILFHWRIEQIK